MTDVLTDPWGPQHAPALPSFYDDEPPLCQSMYYPAPGGVRIGPMVCDDYVGHPKYGGPGSDHCGGSAVLSHQWSDVEALESLAEFGPAAVKTGPVCTDCNDLPQSARGLCDPCSRIGQAADNIETPEDEA